MLSKLVNLSFYKRTTPELQQRLKCLASSGLSFSFIEKWLDACNTPNELEQLIDILEKLAAEKNILKRLLDRINESPFSTKDWAKAILIFSKNEQERMPQIKMDHMFEYLSCCAQSQSNQPIVDSFETVVKAMLEEFGYDGEDS